MAEGDGGADFPDTVILQMPDGKFGMVGAPRRPELLEQRRSIAINVRKGNIAGLATTPSAEGVQDEHCL
jgi:hypothetical protein